MKTTVYTETLKICQRHADRLVWAMQAMEKHLPFSADTLGQLTDVEMAILDQFTVRFAKLQDVMGAKLFPVVLELAKEPVGLDAFVDKLNRLEKIGAIASAEQWLMLREMRNAFSHEYPDDPDIQAAILNKAFSLASELLATLREVEVFANRYV